MSKGAIQNKKQAALLAILIATVFSATHLINGPTEGMNIYLSWFAASYFIVITMSIVFAVQLNKGWRLLAIINCIIAALLFAYDLFGISLGAMQF